MKTDLKYILRRNKTTLLKFLVSNHINTYSDLLRVCEERKFIPVSLEEYESCLPKEVKQKESKAKNEIAKKPVVKTEKAKKARAPRRRSSAAQKRRSNGTSIKKVKDT